ncbi:MAG: hypothetical protein H7Y13_11970 [Sphingobacteriaceae bacterium]|nr:hypothetical protein [Sphingobacteriaceae bacterium]
MENQTPATTEKNNGSNLPAVNQSAVLENTIIGKNSSFIAETIQETITKLKESPSFIAQAEAINSQMKTLVEMGKAEIEGYKVAAFMASGR